MPEDEVKNPQPEQKPGGKTGVEGVTGGKEKSKGAQWLLQLLLERLLEKDLGNLRKEIEKLRQQLAAGQKPEEETVGVMAKLRGIARKMLAKEDLGKEEREAIEEMVAKKSEEVKKEVAGIVQLYDELQAGRKSEEEVVGKNKVSGDLDVVVKGLEEVKAGVGEREDLGRVRTGLAEEEMSVGVSRAFRNRRIGDPGREVSFGERIGREEYAEVAGYNLGRKFERLKSMIDENVVEGTPQWYRHVRMISELATFLWSDPNFEQRLKHDVVSTDSQGQVMRFLQKTKEFADRHTREYAQRREYNWLTGDWNNVELHDFFRNVFAGMRDVVVGKDATGIDILGRPEDAIMDTLVSLQGRPAGAAAVGDVNQAQRFLELIQTIPGYNLDDFLLAAARAHGRRDENDRDYRHAQPLKRDRPEFVALYYNDLLGNMREQLREVMQGKIPQNYWERIQEAEKNGRLAGARTGAHVPRGAMAPPGEGGETPEGAVSPWLAEEFRKEIEKRMSYKDPRGAIEWAFNFFLRNDMSDRDNYYLGTMLKDMMAGSEGELDMLTRATYMEFLSHLQIWRAMGGAKSEDEIMGFMSAVSVGDVEDLMVWKKDFEDVGGLQGIKFTDDAGNLVRLNRASRIGENLKVLEMRGSEIEAMLESQFWFNKFNFVTRGSPANKFRKDIFKEAMFLKMGGEMETIGTGKEMERTYFMRDNAGNRQRVGNIGAIEIQFGDMMVGRRGVKTLEELADDNLWMTAIGENNWEITMKKAGMNHGNVGRRTNYRLDRHLNQNAEFYFGAQKGIARGNDWIYRGYGKGWDRKPYLDTLQLDFVSERAKPILMPFLLSEGDALGVDKEGKTVVLVKGVKNLLGGGDDKLAQDLAELFNRKFMDSRGNLRDMEVIRNLYDQNFVEDPRWGPVLGNMELPRWIKPEYRAHLRFSDREKNLLKKARWEDLMKYLCEYTVGTKLSQKELEYMIKQMGGSVVWENRGGAKVDHFDWGGAGEPTAEGREIGAKLFLKTFSRQRMFWEKDVQDQFHKQGHYFRNIAALNEKLAAYALNPSADNLIAWLAPYYGFREAEKVRELAYRNADGFLDARSRWSFRSNMIEVDRQTKYAKWEGVDAEGRPAWKERQTVLRVLGKAALPWNWVKSAKGTWKAMTTSPGETIGKVWERVGEDARIFLEGKTAMRGYEPLDAWAKKNFIDKIWHTGLIDWWMKERLMARHVAPKIPILTPWLMEGLDSKNPLRRTLAVTLGYIPGLITRPMFLYLWIHDWGKAQASFWNEVVTPALFGEEAKAYQVKA